MAGIEEMIFILERRLAAVEERLGIVPPESLVIVRNSKDNKLEKPNKETKK
jgi:hypothetical protein